MIEKDGVKNTSLKGTGKNKIVDGKWTKENIARAKKVMKDNFEEINSIIRTEETAARSAL